MSKIELFPSTENIFILDPDDSPEAIKKTFNFRGDFSKGQYCKVKFIQFNDVKDLSEFQYKGYTKEDLLKYISETDYEAYPKRYCTMKQFIAKAKGDIKKIFGNFIYNGELTIIWRLS